MRINLPMGVVVRRQRPGRGTPGLAERALEDVDLAGEERAVASWRSGAGSISLCEVPQEVRR